MEALKSQNISHALSCCLEVYSYSYKLDEKQCSKIQFPLHRQAEILWWFSFSFSHTLNVTPQLEIVSVNSFTWYRLVGAIAPLVMVSCSSHSRHSLTKFRVRTSVTYMLNSQFLFKCSLGIGFGGYSLVPTILPWEQGDCMYGCLVSTWVYCGLNLMFSFITVMLVPLTTIASHWYDSSYPIWSFSHWRKLWTYKLILFHKYLNVTEVLQELEICTLACV